MSERFNPFMMAPQAPPRPSREPKRERRELIPPVEIGLSINGFPLTARLKLTAKDIAQLQDIDDPEKAASFIESRLEGAELVARESKSEICRQIIDEVYAGRAPSRLDPQRGTRPTVEPGDMRKLYGRRGLELLAMRDAGDSEWGEPFSFSFNRYGYNNEDSFESLEFSLRKAAAAAVEVDFEERPELFSPDLVRSLESRRYEKKMSAERAYREQLAKDIEALKPEDLIGWRDSIVKAMGRDYHQTAEDGETVGRFFDQVPLDEIRERLQKQEFQDLWNPNEEGADFGREKAHAAFKNEVIHQAAYALSRFYRKEISAKPETAIFRTHVVKKLESLESGLADLNNGSGLLDKLKVLEDLMKELHVKYSYNAPALTAETALRKGRVGDLFAYASNLDNVLMRSGNELRRLTSAVESLHEKLYTPISEAVRKRVKSELRGRFDVSLDTYFGERFAFDQAQKKAVTPADKRYFNKRKTEYFSALAIPYAVAIQANEIYQGYKKSKKTDALLKMASLLGAHDACSGLNICFPLHGADSLTTAQKERLLAAARRIESNLAAPGLEQDIEAHASRGYEHRPSDIEDIKTGLQELLQALKKAE
jgi:hypothetical protein